MLFNRNASLAQKSHLAGWLSWVKLDSLRHEDMHIGGGDDMYAYIDININDES